MKERKKERKGESQPSLPLPSSWWEGGNEVLSILSVIEKAGLSFSPPG